MRLMRIVRSVGPESAGAGENQGRTMAVVTGVGMKTGENETNRQNETNRENKGSPLHEDSPWVLLLSSSRSHCRCYSSITEE